MRTAVVVLLVLLVALAALAEGPVAVVNGEEISRETLYQVTNWSNIVFTIYRQFPRFAQALLATEEGKAVQRRYEEDMLERLILHTLKLHEARKRALRPDEEQLQAEVDRIVADIADRNQLTPSQLLEVLTQQGRTLEEFREEISVWAREELLLAALYEEVIGHVTVDETDIAGYYEDHEHLYYDAEGNLRPLQEVREEIESTLLDVKRREVWQAWLEQLREEAEVAINL